jgi:glycerol uptake facilitator-like aquaporin
MARQLVAEFIGTFALVFIAVSTTYWWYPDFVAMGLACGVTVGVLVTAFARLGSGQFNPAITLGLLLGGKLRLMRALFIIPLQIVAAVMACFILASFLGTNEKMNWIEGGPIDEATGQQTATMRDPVSAGTPTIPARLEIPEPVGQVAARVVPGSQRVSILQAIVLEAMLTFFWGLAVFAGLRRGNQMSMGVMVGGAVMVGILVCGILTGAAMNPARAFGPYIAMGDFSFYWIYVAGPFVGMALGGFAWRFTHALGEREK